MKLLAAIVAALALGACFGHVPLPLLALALFEGPPPSCGADACCPDGDGGWVPMVDGGSVCP